MSKKVAAEIDRLIELALKYEVESFRIKDCMDLLERQQDEGIAPVDDDEIAELRTTLRDLEVRAEAAETELKRSLVINKHATNGNGSAR